MNSITSDAGLLAGSRELSRDSAWRVFGTLWLLQSLLVVVLFPEFLSGKAYFAYLDIAADTYENFTGYTVHLARLLQRDGLSGWSFGVGWGAPTIMMFAEAFRFLNILGGADHVLELRIWVYVLKIVLGGTFFLLWIRPLVRQREAALLTALAYSFCGYMVVNGEWDTEAQAFVFFPLILWAIDRTLRDRDVFWLPLSVGAALLSGLFFVNVAVSLGVAFVACAAVSERPGATARQWFTRVFPLSALGFALAAPLLVPLTLQMLDSPRVTVQGSFLAQILGQVFQVSSWNLFVQQVGSIFHKDMFGVGDLHYSYMNYLESPEFYAGMLPLLAAAQVWRGPRGDRRLLLVACAGVLLYFTLPVFRLAAFGFATPYFRATTLWVTLAILLVGARGLDRLLEHGVDRRALGAAALVVGAMLAVVLTSSQHVWPAHVTKTVVLVVAWLLVLFLLGGTRMRARLVPAMLLLALVEIVVMAWPSYYALREHASPAAQPANDMTLPALAAIRKADPSPFYRVEKMYQSKSEADAVLQDYYGVRSYYYHGRAVIDFHQSMGLMRRWGAFRPINATNWTAAPQDRYFLHSLLGVRYLISKKPVDWPGFEPLASGPDWFVFRNELALPLAFVQSQQVTRGDMAALDKLATDRQQWFKDAALINAVVLDQLLPEWGEHYDLAGLASRGVMDVPSVYAKPAQALQRTGLVIDSFRNDRITGHIAPQRAGVLVFTIPAYQGWSLRVDGRPTPLMTVNFGMIGAPVTAGPHRIELRYSVPGLGFGWAVFALACVVMVAIRAVAGRRAARAA